MTNWKKWAVAALIRAVRTFAEAMIAYIGTGAVVLGDVNWLAALSAGAFSFVLAGPDRPAGSGAGRGKVNMCRQCRQSAAAVFGSYMNSFHDPGMRFIFHFSLPCLQVS